MSAIKAMDLVWYIKYFIRPMCSIKSHACTDYLT